MKNKQPSRERYRISKVRLCDGKSDLLLARLEDQVFHLTTATAFTEIKKTGGVLHNKEGRYGLNTSSERSFGRLMGYVCLFDLRDHSKETLKRILDDYYFLGPSWFEMARGAFKVAELRYLILHKNYYDRIIPNHAALDHLRTTGKYLHFVPNGEVWIEEQLPLEWIDTVISVTIRRPVSLMERTVESVYRD